MQQRRPRLGDILDDYCPRERRITNHAVVAMIDDQIKQTRCTTCDADHDYKQAKVPAPRRKKDGSALVSDLPEGASRPRPVPASTAHSDEVPEDLPSVDPFEEPPLEVFVDAEPPDADLDTEADADTNEDSARTEDEGPVHRRLIRATLPRPEGQVPERKNPEFTVRQPGSRGREFENNKNGPRHGHGRRPMRTQGGSQGQPTRFGPSGSNNTFRQGSGQPQRPGGNRPPGPGGNQRGGNRPGGRGPRPNAGGGGRKRGR